ncbi:MAG: hypothetical protein Fur007_16300 [Rhodoferax sp.]
MPPIWPDGSKNSLGGFSYTPTRSTVTAAWPVAPNSVRAKPSKLATVRRPCQDNTLRRSRTLAPERAGANKGVRWVNMVG